MEGCMKMSKRIKWQFSEKAANMTAGVRLTASDLFFFLENVEEDIYFKTFIVCELYNRGFKYPNEILSFFERDLDEDDDVVTIYYGPEVQNKIVKVCEANRELH